MPEAYLETNAFSDLFRSNTAWEGQLRRDLRASARSGRIRYLTSAWTIEELAGLVQHDRPKYGRIVRFLFELVGPGLIDDPPTLVERELRLGRPLRNAERFLGRERQREIRRLYLDPAIALEISQETRRENRAAKAELGAMRDLIWGKLAELSKKDPRAKGDPRAATLAWFAEAERWIDEWSRNSLSKILTEMAVDPSVAATYPLDRVPTIRNMVAAMLARIAWNSGHGRRIEEGDNLDSRHYVAACHADIFVTSDRRFGEVIELLPRPAVRPITLVDFARLHLGWRAR